MVGVAGFEPTTTTPPEVLVQKSNPLIINDFIDEIPACKISVENYGKPVCIASDSLTPTMVPN